MSERSPDAPSIFDRVDQSAMLDRLADSPLEDAEIGYLSDCNAAGERQVSQALLDGIRIFAGDSGVSVTEAELVSDHEDLPGVQDTSVDPSVNPDSPEAARRAFILFGPAGRLAQAGGS